MKNLCKALSTLLLLCMLCTLCTVAGAASGRLSLHAKFSDKPIENALFEVYRVLDIDESGKKTITAAFTPYADSLKDYSKMGETARAELAKSLERAISLDAALTPDASATSNADGDAVLDALPNGLYLVTVRPVKDGTLYTYTFAPFFVSLPNTKGSTDLAANVKPTIKASHADLKVIKIWKDSCHPSRRPASIELKLWCDGTLYETITLPHEGHWQYTWTGLETAHVWVVTEETITGYLAPTITLSGEVFTVTNTCNKPSTPSPRPTPDPTPDKPEPPTPDTPEPPTPDTPEPPTPDKPEPPTPDTPEPPTPDTPEPPTPDTPEPPTPDKPEPPTPDTPEPPTPDKPEPPTPDKPEPPTPVTPDTPDEPILPDEPIAPDTPTTPEEPDIPKLPQTGQLWWPLPVLICAGLVCIVIGLLMRRGASDEE